MASAIRANRKNVGNYAGLIAPTFGTDDEAITRDAKQAATEKKIEDAHARSAPSRQPRPDGVHHLTHSTKLGDKL